MKDNAQNSFTENSALDYLINLLLQEDNAQNAIKENGALDYLNNLLPPEFSAAFQTARSNAQNTSNFAVKDDAQNSFAENTTPPKLSIAKNASNSTMKDNAQNSFAENSTPPKLSNANNASNFTVKDNAQNSFTENATPPKLSIANDKINSKETKKSVMLGSRKHKKQQISLVQRRNIEILCRSKIS